MLSSEYHVAFHAVEYHKLSASAVHKQYLRIARGRISLCSEALHAVYSVSASLTAGVPEILHTNLKRGQHMRTGSAEEAVESRRISCPFNSLMLVQIV